MRSLTKESLHRERANQYTIEQWTQLQDWLNEMFRGARSRRQLGIFFEKTGSKSFKVTLEGALGKAYGSVGRHESKGGAGGKNTDCSFGLQADGYSGVLYGLVHGAIGAGLFRGGESV